MNALMTAMFVADCIWATWIAGLGNWTVILAFAERMSNWVDWRQVQYIKAQLGNIRQARLNILERAVLAWLGRGVARKQLIPGAEHSALAIYCDRELAMSGGKLALGIA
jgi:hypothetical protein